MLSRGTPIDGYRIEEPLGEGGMSMVYEARQVSLNRAVALKVLSKELADDEGAFRERFERECEIQAELDHPHIVPIYDSGRSAHGLWLAMRLVRGETLRDLLASERLSPERALEILAPIAKALDIAHQRELIHRDITPRNILIDETGHPYLADFGITKRRGDRSLTKPGQFVGTIEYIAPEQIKDDPAVPETDVYSLAAILFECLSGRVPFEREDDRAVLVAHLVEPPPRASETDSSLPPALDPVMEKGLAKLPEDRYARRSDLIEDVRSAHQADTTAPAPPAPSPEQATPLPEPPPPEAVPQPIPAAPERGRRAVGRRVAPVGLVAGFVLVVGLGIGALLGGGSSPQSRSASAGELEIQVPSEWGAAKGRTSGIEGLPLADPLVLTPRDGERESAVIGMSPATGKTLLPADLRRTLAGPARGTPVSLGSLQALRYLGLRPSDPGGPLTVFASPTSGGVATVACRPSGPGTELSQLCQRLASTLELTRGSGFELGPSSELARSLQRQLGTLDRRRADLRRTLRAANGPKRQAAAAAALADAFRDAARPLARERVTPQSSAGLAGVVGALRETRDAYKDLATAARREDESAYDDAAGRVTAAESNVDRSLRAMRGLGYRVGSPS